MPGALLWGPNGTPFVPYIFFCSYGVLTGYPAAVNAKQHHKQSEMSIHVFIVSTVLVKLVVGHEIGIVATLHNMLRGFL